MSVANLQDVSVEIFGGLNTSMAPADLPPGASPFCQDVIFPEGGVKSRPPLSSFQSGINGNPSILGLKTYITPQFQLRLLAWTSLGSLYKEVTPGLLALQFSQTLLSSISNTAYRSTSIFGREYMAMRDRNLQSGSGVPFGIGADIPRQYDDTFLDRVSQDQVGTAISLAPADAGAAGNVSAGLHQVTVAFITRQGYITKPCPPVAWTAAGSKKATVTGIPTGPGNIVGRIVLFTQVITAPATTGTFFSILSTMQINDNTTTSLTVDFTDAALAAGFNGEYLFSQQILGNVAFFGSYNSRLVAMGEQNNVPNFQCLGFDGGFNGTFPAGWLAYAGHSTGGAQDNTNAAWLSSWRITGDGATAIVGGIQQPAYQDFLGVPILSVNTAYSIRFRALQSGATQGTLTLDLFSSSLGTTLGSFTMAASSIEPIAQGMGAYTGILLASQTSIPSDLVLRMYVSGTMNNGAFVTIDSIEIFPTATPIISSYARFSHVNNPESFDGVTGFVGIRPNDGQILRAGFPLRNNYYLGKDHYLCYVADDGINEPSSWQVTEVSATIGICGPDAVDWTEEWAVFAERSGVYVCMGADPIKINQEIFEDASGTGKVSWSSVNWTAATAVWVRIDQQNRRILVGAPVGSATVPNVIFVMDYKFSPTPEYISAGPGVVYSSFSGKLISHGGARKWTIWNAVTATGAFIERFDGTSKLFLGNGSNNGTVYQVIEGNYPTNGTYVDTIFGAIQARYQTAGVPHHSEEQALQLRAHRKRLSYLTGRLKGSGTTVVTVSQATWANGYVTVTTNPVHGYLVGDTVIITGSTDATYNGTYQIVAVPNPTTFMYLLPTVNSQSANGLVITSTANLKVLNSFRTTQIRGVGLSSTPAGDWERPVNVAGERIFIEISATAPGAWFQLEKLIPDMMIDAPLPVRGTGY